MYFVYDEETLININRIYEFKGIDEILKLINKEFDFIIRKYSPTLKSPSIMEIILRKIKGIIN